MEETTRALIIVDVQPTFCEGGALAVAGGNAVAERIADFVTANLDEYALIVTTQDWHVKPGSHFSDAPDFVDSWPPHGVAGTPEAELHEAIASLPIDAAVKKGEYAAAYSGFEGVDGQGRSLEDILRGGEVASLDVVGIAESHCVKETALDGLRAGWPVRVLSDLTVPVSEELGEDARREMDEAGVEQIVSSEAFGFYEEGEDAEIPGDTAGLADSEGELDESEYGTYDLEDDDDDDADADNATDDDFEEDFDFGGLVSAGIQAMSQRAGSSDADVDLDDFEIDGEEFEIEDEEIDFSGEVSDDDFDFSDIDFDPTKE